MQNPLNMNTITCSPNAIRRALRLFISLSFSASLACSASAQENNLTHTTAERPYFNDKKVPEAKDLLAIQKLLQKNKDKARAATVGIQQGSASGSGVIISEDGLVLSAAHVTAGVNIELTVIMEDGTKHNAISLGLNSDNDAAMLQITDKGKYPFVHIEPEKLEKNASTKLGDWVFSLGHSGGFNKNRGSGLRLGRLGRIDTNTFQSDCSLIGGDSGGPLFDINGMLIGIHSRVGVVTEMNMHVPMYVFHKYWDRMKKGEFIGNGPFATKPKKGAAFIGIAVEDAPNGLKIIDIDKTSPAGKAGVQIGDILTMIDKIPLKQKNDLAKFMKNKAERDKITLSILRGKEKIQTELKLVAR